jgi:hypothetical protein
LVIHMTVNELAATLKLMYEKAPKGDSTTMIHLFGVRYADEIKRATFTPKEILRAAGMPESYQTEISKGVRLAKYVMEKGSE